MDKEQEITEVLRKIAELCKLVVDYTAIENFSIRRIKDDVSYLNQKKVELAKELENGNQHLNDIKLEAKRILDEAKADAEKLIRIERENLAYTSADRIAAQQELEKAKQARYLAEKKLDSIPA